MPSLRRAGGSINYVLALWFLTMACTTVAMAAWSRFTRTTTVRRSLALQMTTTTPSTNSLIICGPSGVGKGTVIKALLTHWGPDRLALSVSHTTRAPRPGEVDGVHYYFVTKARMQEALIHQPGSFLEHAEVHGNLYGTSRDAVDSIHKQGKACILDVDVNGVKSMKRLSFPGKYVFLTPQSIETLSQRLKLRGSETEAQIAQVRNLLPS